MPNDTVPPEPGPEIGRPRAGEPTFPDVADVAEDTDDVYRAPTAPPGAREQPGERAHRDLLDLAVRLRTDASQVSDPRLHTLLEASAEVLLGLSRAFADHAGR